MIKHLSHYNDMGQPQHYYTLTKEELEVWRKNQTPEQKLFDDWNYKRQYD